MTAAVGLIDGRQSHFGLMPSAVLGDAGEQRLGVERMTFVFDGFGHVEDGFVHRSATACRTEPCFRIHLSKRYSI